jgi:hypothetical protein
MDVVPLRDWHDGRYLWESDEQILLVARSEGRTLVTFDRHSIPLVLRHLAEAGLDHGGVIFISAKTIGQHDIGGIAESLARLAAAQQDISLDNRILFLPT